MNKKHIIGLVTAATLLVAGSAWAGIWSSYIQLANLDTATDGYVVYPATSAGNPAGCANASPIYGYSASTAVEKDLMNKTLLSAFLANRSVKINVASTVCSSAGYPVYIAVRLDSAN